MHPYPYVMDLRKSIQAMAYLLKQADDKVYSYTDILKMLYRADIRSFKETAYPILRAGGDLKAIMKGRYEPDRGSWREYMSLRDEDSKKETKIVLVRDPGTGELCPYEKDVLEEVFKEVSNE